MCQTPDPVCWKSRKQYLGQSQFGTRQILKDQVWPKIQGATPDLRSLGRVEEGAALCSRPPGDASQRKRYRVGPQDNQKLAVHGGEELTLPNGGRMYWEQTGPSIFCIIAHVLFFSELSFPDDLLSFEMSSGIISKNLLPGCWGDIAVPLLNHFLGCQLITCHGVLVLMCLTLLDCEFQRINHILLVFVFLEFSTMLDAFRVYKLLLD